MGTNRRYAHRVDEQMARRADQVVMRDGTPETLTDREPELDRLPLTRAPQPIPVRVWVRYGSIPIRVDAVAVSWTARATAVRWDIGNGDEHRAWVWSTAVAER